METAVSVAYRRAKRLPRNMRHLVGMCIELLREWLPFAQPRYHARALVDPNEIKLARQLSTLTFVRRGKISESEVDQDGILLHDAFLTDSTFFGVFDRRNNTIVAAMRLIGGNPEKNALVVRIPLGDLYPDEFESLMAHPNGTVAEIGALAKATNYAPTVAVIKLYSTMFRWAAENGLTTLICAIEPKVVPRYNFLFGGALRKIGPIIQNRGIKGPQEPLRIDLATMLTTHRQHNSQYGICRRTVTSLVRRLIGDYTPYMKAAA